MREAWLQRVDDQYFGKVWSDAYARRTVEQKVDSALEDSQLKVLEFHQLQGVNPQSEATQGAGGHRSTATTFSRPAAPLGVF